MLFPVQQEFLIPKFIQNFFERKYLATLHILSDFLLESIVFKITQIIFKHKPFEIYSFLLNETLCYSPGNHLNKNINLNYHLSVTNKTCGALVENVLLTTPEHERASVKWPART